MFTEKDYYFTIIVSPEGYQYPLINYILKEYQFLETLVYSQNLRKSTGVINAISIIDKVLNKESNEEEIYNRDLPIDILSFALIKKEVSIIVDCTAGNRDFELKTIELKKMFQKWLEFLLKYENDEIPNLKYAFK